jgi:short chain dehydrogenase
VVHLVADQGPEAPHQLGKVSTWHLGQRLNDADRHRTHLVLASANDAGLDAQLRAYLVAPLVEQVHFVDQEQSRPTGTSDRTDSHSRLTCPSRRDSDGLLGYQLSVSLARMGAHLVMACHSLQRAEQARDLLRKEAPAASVTVVPPDLAEPDSIQELGALFGPQVGRLDVLIHNAGVYGVPLARTRARTSCASRRPTSVRSR